MSLVTLLCGLLFAPLVGSAQVEVGEGDAYRNAVRMALDEYDAGSYAEAREQFLRAHSLYPNARTLRGLGFIEYELHNYVASIRYLEQALASKVKPLEGETRADTETVLKRARGYLGTVELDVAPSTAVVTLAGEPLQRESGGALRLPVGDHVLVFHAPGHVGQRRVVRVRGGETQTVEVKLAEDPALSASAAQPQKFATEREPHRQPVYKKWWLWTAVGAVAAGAVVGTLYATRGEVERPIGSGNTPADGALSTR